MLPMLAAPATVFSVLVTLPDIQLPGTAAYDESNTAAAVDSNKCYISLHLPLMTAADAYSRTFIAVESCKCCNLQLALLTAADAGVPTAAAVDTRSCLCPLQLPL